MLTIDAALPRREAEGGASAAVVSAEIPDWSREVLRPGEWAPGKRLLACIRDYQRAQAGEGMFCGIRRRLAAARHRVWSAVSGAEIPLNARIAGGLLLPHPNGIVIHPDAVIGPNCLLFQQVTLGSCGAGGVPVLGGHVDVGAGAKILGGVHIGAHARIGANAVVLCDVPDAATAVGIPARLVSPRN